MAARKPPHPRLYPHLRLAGAGDLQCRQRASLDQRERAPLQRALRTAFPRPSLPCRLEISWPESEACRSRCTLLPAPRPELSDTRGQPCLGLAFTSPPKIDISLGSLFES
jgi:hypothetical protein